MTSSVEYTGKHNPDKMASNPSIKINHSLSITIIRLATIDNDALADGTESENYS